MAEEPELKRSDKAEATEKPKPKKPPGYRKFKKLLEQVVTAPPLKKSIAAKGESVEREPV